MVTTYTPSQGSIARLMVDLTYKRRLLEIGLDLMLIGVSYYLAYWIRNGLDMTEASMTLFLRSWPVALGCAYLAFYLFGVYRGVWRYVGFNDLVRYTQAAIGAVAMTALALRLIYVDGYTLDVFLLYLIFLFLGLAASRSSFQILDRLYGRQRMNAKQANVLLYGADDAGEMALRWILRNANLGFRPVGFLDNDPYKWRRSIHDVDVLGGMDSLEEVLGDKAVDGVIVSSCDMLAGEDGVKLLTVCRSRGVWVKALRLEFEAVE